MINMIRIKKDGKIIDVYDVNIQSITVIDDVYHCDFLTPFEPISRYSNPKFKPEEIELVDMSRFDTIGDKCWVNPDRIAYVERNENNSDVIIHFLRYGSLGGGVRKVEYVPDDEGDKYE
jgi:hypothetical protein